jgi:hypothetical protein
MSISESLLEVRSYSGEGYRPLVDYGQWRVAVLRYHPELEPDAIGTMQRHDQTDEVFVLLAGRCILFLGEGQAQVESLHAQDMEPLKIYNVKRSAWHTHTLSHDAAVLIVENVDTTIDNSPTVSLSSAQRAELVQLTKRLWG